MISWKGASVLKSILASVDPEETRVAILEDGALQAVEMERSSHAHLVGNIYKGRVQNVLPGMQAAFVDIGSEKNAFLYIGDGKTHDPMRAGDRPARIHVGQSLPVQITKDAYGTKGPRATTHITLPGRTVVLLPTAAYIALSHRIEDEAERERLHAIAERVCPEGMGLLVRTAAVHCAEEAIAADVRQLVRLWQVILARYELARKGASLLYRDADLLIRIVRDSFSEEVDELIVDDREAFSRVSELVAALSPDLLPRMRLHSARAPLFAAYGVEKEIEKLGAREVELKNGGFLVIDKTEALTAIDVNTGKYVGKTNLAETVYRTNLEAAEEIVKQIRLRDIGGIIIIDFIDMEREEHRESLLAHLRELASRDRTKTNVVDITGLGLVEITRKKSRQNFDSMVYSACPVCHGLGRVESPETVAIRISRAIRRMERTSHASEGYEIEVHESVAEELRTNQLMMNLAAQYGTDIKVTAKAGMHPENYAIAQQFSCS